MWWPRPSLGHHGPSGGRPGPAASCARWRHRLPDRQGHLPVERHSPVPCQSGRQGQRYANARRSGARRTGTWQPPASLSAAAEYPARLARPCAPSAGRYPGAEQPGRTHPHGEGLQRHAAGNQREHARPGASPGSDAAGRHLPPQCRGQAHQGPQRPAGHSRRPCTHRRPPQAGRGRVAPPPRRRSRPGRYVTTRARD